MVAVDADRKNGIEQLMKISRPDIILLDDAFQHRRVRAGFYILLTAYNDLYADDYMLPAGNLRESRSGAKRANVVIVTKCPSDLFEKEKNRIERKLRLKPGQLLFFTSIAYDEFIYSEEEQLPVESIRNTAKVILAGIAKPAPFFGYLKNDDDTVLAFPDHHHFTDKDIEAIKDKAGDRIIIATEKDYVRLKGRLPEAQLFYLPIRSLFLGNAPQFDEMITAYVNNIIK